MTEHFEEPDGVEETPSGPDSDEGKLVEAASSDTSLLSRLRDRRKEMAGERDPYQASIPGYNGELVGKFRALDWKELRGIALRVEKSRSDMPELLGHLDTLINSCVELFASKDGELVPLSEVLGVDEPVKFDHNLATVLELNTETANSARRVVRAVFPSDLAVTSFHNDLAEWMQDFSKGVDEDFLGEYRGA